MLRGDALEAGVAANPRPAAVRNPNEILKAQRNATITMAGYTDVVACVLFGVRRCVGGDDCVFRVTGIAAQNTVHLSTMLLRMLRKAIRIADLRAVEVFVSRGTSQACGVPQKRRIAHCLPRSFGMCS